MRVRLRQLRSRIGKRVWLFAVPGIALAILLGGGAYAALGGAVRPVASTDVELQKGLVGHWKMDGNAKDSSPYRNNGTVSGATLTTNRKGLSNSAYSFNGASTTFTIPYNAAFNPTAAISVGVWFKSGPNPTTNVERIVSNIDGGGYALYQTYTGTADDCGDSNLCWKVRVNGTYRHVSVAVTSLTNGTWYYLTGTFDGEYLRLYIDGSLVATSASFPGTIGTNTSALCIGAAPTGAACDSNYLRNNAVIDDVRIYSRAINAGEIIALSQSYDSSVQAAAGLDGLVGHWKLDGNAKDSSPYSNNGTLNGTNTQTTDRKGSADAAYTYDGTTAGNYIEMLSNSAYNSANVTVSAWLYPTSGVATARMAVSRDNNTSDADGRWALGHGGTAGTFRFIVNIAGSGYGAASATGFSTNQWHHVVGTYDGVMPRLYVDGVLVDTGPSANASLPSNTGTIRIGNAHNGTGRWPGGVDDVRVYNRPLDLAEIKNIGTSYDSQISVSSLRSGLVGHWPFNGTAKDATPYRSHGSVTSATLTTDRKGRSNSGYAFDGTGDYITATSTSLPLSTANQSVTAWIYSGTLSSIKNIVYITHSTPNQELRFRTSGSGKLQLSNDGTALATGTATLSTSTWYHVGFTWDGSDIRLYLNGVIDGPPDPDPLQSSGASMNTVQIGKGASGAQDFQGSIDDVRIYSRTLSAAEMAALYDSYQ